jgi:L-amino acid N-acyltransferase YncA
VNSTSGADGVVLRQAGEDDWERIWPIWHEVVAAGDTYMWAPDSTSRWARGTWLDGPPSETWIADDAATGEALGTYHVSPNQPGAGAHIVNGSYMVAASARGRGIGRTLVLHSLQRCRELGYRGMQFNAVAATNVGAIGLYHSLGFTTIGVVPGGFRHSRDGFVDLHVMFRSLSDR